MPKKPLDYDLLASFTAVAEEKSFTKAALRLGLAKGTVSRAIAELEELLGAELVHRTTHSVALSTAGTALYERTAIHLRALDDAIGHLPEPGERPSGVLRLTAAPALGTGVLPEVLAQFALRYPELSFDLHITNATVDLVAQGFDVAIRTFHRGMKRSMLTMRKLGESNGAFYAAPSYLARRGYPKAMTCDHEWLLHPVSLRHWKLTREEPRIQCDDFVILRELACEGVGITFLPTYLGDPHVRSGKLEQLSIAGRTMTVPVVMLYPSRGQISHNVIAFRDFFTEWLQKTPLG
jgi:DNA-binding transcriptional LysR family regulator